MSWVNKYWGIVHHLYWWPPYIGMRSISQKYWKEMDGMICVPSEMVNKTGPLYSRKLKINELTVDLHGKEEILNHLFDIVFSIAPDSILNDLLLKPMGFNDLGTFETIDGAINGRYDLGQGNITQPDGFYISKNTILGVELKLKSKSSPSQIAKYAALIAWEELHKGPREQLGLLFIIPEKSIEKHWAGCGLNGNTIDRSFLETEWEKPLPQPIADLFSTNYEHVASIIDRMTLEVISWKDLKASMSLLLNTLDTSHRGDQTLYRLIEGFMNQLDSHRGTGL